MFFSQERRSASDSGIRRLIRHMNKSKRNVHPIDETLSPQLIVRHGSFEVFDPEDTLRKMGLDDGRHIAM